MSIADEAHGIADGACLCGAVAYRIVGEPKSISICHCRSCRLASGAPSVTWFVVDKAQFQLLRGQPMTFRSSPPVVRGFCGRCGTPLTYENADAPDEIELTTATLHRPDDWAPTREIWLGEKLAWITPDPALAHYAGAGPGSSG